MQNNVFLTTKSQEASIHLWLHKVNKTPLRTILAAEHDSQQTENTTTYLKKKELKRMNLKRLH